ncbi:MAG: chemotaxis protein CheD [Candidatus Lindowbacteria bacterium]|nr:chemotaxis protein CheD [Candidatus Lindowbacteria bacterium]
MEMRTVLGSCIGLAVYDPRSKVGGIVHVMLPESRGNSVKPGKFADTGVPALIKQIIANGGVKSNLQVKISGGAKMFAFATSSAMDIGARNIEAVHQALAEEGLKISREDVGGTKGRKLIVDCETGDIYSQIIGEDKILL